MNEFFFSLKYLLIFYKTKDKTNYIKGEYARWFSFSLLAHKYNTSHTPAFGGGGKQVVPVGMACLRKNLFAAIPTGGLALWGAPCPFRHHQTWLVWAHHMYPPGAALRRKGGGMPPPAEEHGSHKGPDVGGTRSSPAGTGGAVGLLRVELAGNVLVPLPAPVGTRFVLEGGPVCCIRHL